MRPGGSPPSRQPGPCHARTLRSGRRSPTARDVAADVGPTLVTCRRGRSGATSARCGRSRPRSGRSSCRTGWPGAMDPATVRSRAARPDRAVVPDALDLADVRLRGRAGQALVVASLRLRRCSPRTGSARSCWSPNVPCRGSEPRPGAGGPCSPGSDSASGAADGDPGLPALPTLTDPTAARPLLESALRDGGRPELRLEEVRPQLVRYKPGHRATFVLRPSLRRRTPTRPGRGGSSPRPTATTAAPRPTSWMRPCGRASWVAAGVPRLAEPLGYLAEPPDAAAARPSRRPDAGRPGRRIPRPPRHGRSWAGPCTRPPTGWSRSTAPGWQPARRGRRPASWPRPAGCSSGWPRRSPSTRGSTPRRSSTRSPCSAGQEQRGATPVHGAFRPAQVLLDGSRPGFLDFDGFGQGEPAFDVGRFLARLAELVADRTRRAQLTHAFLDRYRAGAPLPADRTALWVCLDLATGAVRSWYRATPRPGERAPRPAGRRPRRRLVAAAH